jgi:hypothetical protein
MYCSPPTFRHGFTTLLSPLWVNTRLMNWASINPDFTLHDLHWHRGVREFHPWMPYSLHAPLPLLFQGFQAITGRDKQGVYRRIPALLMDYVHTLTT